MLFSLKCQFRWNGLPLDSQAAAVLSRNISHPWLTFCNIFMYYETENLESGDDSHSCSCLRWGHNDIRGNLPYHHKLCLHLIANSRNREPVSLTIFFDLARVLLVTVWTGGGGEGNCRAAPLLLVLPWLLSTLAVLLTHPPPLDTFYSLG